MIKVSVLTPTTIARDQFNDRIRAIVSGQDYPHIEHIIDYSEGSVGDKRNRMTASATGDIIVNMDSDDWYASDWVSRCVAEIADFDVIGLKKAVFSCNGSMYTYTYPDTDNCLHGATMCYTKRFWERNPFQLLQVGEDYFFTRNARVGVMDYLHGFIATIHDGNTSKKNVSGDRWVNYEMSAPYQFLQSLPLSR